MSDLRNHDNEKDSPQNAVENALWELGKEKPETRALIGELIIYLRDKSANVLSSSGKKEHLKIIGSRLMKARKEKGLSPAELAASLGCSEAAVRFWENGDRSIGNKWHNKMEEALGIKMKDILGISS